MRDGLEFSADRLRPEARARFGDQNTASATASARSDAIPERGLARREHEGGYSPPPLSDVIAASSAAFHSAPL